MAEEQLDVRFAMPAGDLAKLIDKTRFAISTEETRYYLNGIHVHATKGGAAPMLRGVATDGHRLARVEVALPEGAERHPADHRPAQDRGRDAQAPRRATTGDGRGRVSRDHASSSPRPRGR